MLRTLADHLEVIWGGLLAAAIVVLLTPAVGGMARLLGAVDRPEGRRLNRSTVPRLGGLALFFGIFVPALAFLDLSGEARGLLLGAAVATTVGAIDDFRGLRWWEKLGGQVAAAAIPVGFGIWVHRFTFPILGIHSLPDWIGMPLSVLWIVAIMNMVNFLDGLDGLAAGVSAISPFTLPLIAVPPPRPEIPAAVLSATALGAVFRRRRPALHPPGPARRMASVAGARRLPLRTGRAGCLRVHGVPARDREARESDDQAPRRGGTRRKAEVGLVVWPVTLPGSWVASTK